MRNNAPMYQEWLRTQIDAKGVKQADLARAMGISPDKVSKIMKGTRRIGAEELRKAIAFFGDTPPGFTPVSTEQTQETLELLSLIPDEQRERAIAVLRLFVETGAAPDQQGDEDSAGKPQPRRR